MTDLTPESLCSFHFFTLFLIARWLVQIQDAICLEVDDDMNCLKLIGNKKESDGLDCKLKIVAEGSLEDNLDGIINGIVKHSPPRIISGI